MNNTTTRNKVWTFCVIYLGYMLLFADRTVFNLALAGIGKDFNMSPAALGAAG
ncbi:MFS transporter, partial [Streptococcus danieliae]|nr:MFS transporter [Streptococcus danieliae]